MVCYSYPILITPIVYHQADFGPGETRVVRLMTGGQSAPGKTVHWDIEMRIGGICEAKGQL